MEEEEEVERIEKEPVGYDTNGIAIYKIIDEENHENSYYYKFKNDDALLFDVFDDNIHYFTMDEDEEKNEEKNYYEMNEDGKIFNYDLLKKNDKDYTKNYYEINDQGFSYVRYNEQNGEYTSKQKYTEESYLSDNDTEYEKEEALDLPMQKARVERLEFPLRQSEEEEEKEVKKEGEKEKEKEVDVGVVEKEDEKEEGEEEEEKKEEEEEEKEGVDVDVVEKKEKKEEEEEENPIYSPGYTQLIGEKNPSIFGCIPRCIDNIEKINGDKLMTFLTAFSSADREKIEDFIKSWGMKTILSLFLEEKKNELSMIKFINLMKTSAPPRSSYVYRIKGGTGIGKTVFLPHLMALFGFNVLICEPRILNCLNAYSAIKTIFGSNDHVGYVAGGASFEGLHLTYATHQTVINNMLKNSSFLNRFDIIIIDESHIIEEATLKLVNMLKNQTNVYIYMSATPPDFSVFEYGIQSHVFEEIEIKGKTMDVTVEEMTEPGNILSLCFWALIGVKKLIERDPGNIIVFLPKFSYHKKFAELVQENEDVKDMKISFITSQLSQKEKEKLNDLYEDDEEEESEKGGADKSGEKRKRKVKVNHLYIATDAGETGITVPNVSVVIDSLLQNVQVYYPYSDCTSMVPGRITIEASKQRMGRAGRTRKGAYICIGTLSDLLSSKETPNPVRYYIYEKMSSSLVNITTGYRMTTFMKDLNQDISKNKIISEVYGEYFVPVFLKAKKMNLLAELIATLVIKSQGTLKNSLEQKEFNQELSFIDKRKTAFYNEFTTFSSQFGFVTELPSFCDFYDMFLEAMIAIYCKDPELYLDEDKTELFLEQFKGMRSYHSVGYDPHIALNYKDSKMYKYKADDKMDFDDLVEKVRHDFHRDFLIMFSELKHFNTAVFSLEHDHYIIEDGYQGGSICYPGNSLSFRKVKGGKSWFINPVAEGFTSVAFSKLEHGYVDGYPAFIIKEISAIINE